MSRTAVLERPGHLAAGEGNALVAAMRRDWPAYVIDVDVDGIWWALRRDGRRAVSGRLPVELLASIIADFDGHPRRAAPGDRPAPAGPPTPGAAPVPSRM